MLHKSNSWKIYNIVKSFFLPTNNLYLGWRLMSNPEFFLLLCSNFFLILLFVLFFLYFLNFVFFYGFVRYKHFCFALYGRFVSEDFFWRMRRALFCVEVVWRDFVLLADRGDWFGMLKKVLFLGFTNRMLFLPFFSDFGFIRIGLIIQLIKNLDVLGVNFIMIMKLTVVTINFIGALIHCS